MTTTLHAFTRSVRQLIKDLGQQHTVLLSSHILPEVEMTCNRVVILHEGKILAADTTENLQQLMSDHGQIIAEGSPPDLIERLGGHHMVEFSLAGDSHRGADNWKSLPGVDSVYHDNGLVCLAVREPHRTIPALLEAVDKQSAQLEHLTTRQASLEDVFVRLTGRHLREE